MANPAKKNGFVPIANELVEQLAKINITGNEMRIIWIVLRKTWGWVDKKNNDRRKDWDWIAYSQFEEETGMKRMNVGRCIKSLVANRLLVKSDKGFKFNQDYEQWVVAKRLPREKKGKGSSQKRGSSSLLATKTGSLLATKSSSLLATHKRKKEIKKKTKESTLSPKNINDSFFQGIEDLINKTTSKNSEKVRDMLKNISSANSKIKKDVMWAEFKRFYLYWTEYNSTGTKMRYQMEKTFEVNRRLSSWFSRKKEFSGFTTSIKGKGKKIIKST